MKNILTISQVSKSLLSTIFLWSIILCTSVSSFSQDLSVMTYNIRLDFEGDGENQWSNRKENVIKQIKFHDPDVFGVQEALPNQMDDLTNGLPDYAVVGVGREDGKRKGEFSALFFKKDLFELQDSGTFWLSETPSIPSTGWDAALPRICTWGLFRIRNSNQNLLIMNTHFDHVGELARQKSVALIYEQAQKMRTEETPLIVMGDLNLEPESTPIKWLQEKMDDSKVMTGSKGFGPIGTFNGWKTNDVVTRRIDYIFLSPYDFQIKKYAVISDYVDLHFLSDHFPVYVEVDLMQRFNEQNRKK